jgi:hypothetical protein
MRDACRKGKREREVMAAEKLKRISALRKGEKGIFHTEAYKKGVIDTYNKQRLAQAGFTGDEMVQVVYSEPSYREVSLLHLGSHAQLLLVYPYSDTENPLCFTPCEITEEMVQGWLDEVLTHRKKEFIASLPHRPNQEHGIGITGTDPECFFLNGKGECLPAFQALKAKPKGSSNEYVRTFWDGYQAEMTVPAAGCHETLMYHVNNGLRTLASQAQVVDPKAKLSWAPEIHLPVDALAEEKEEFVRLGCDPSQNVYGTAGLQVDDPRQLPWRFAGCHMHFSTTKKGSQDVVNTVKAMDAIGGVTLTAALQGMETDVRRRYYGRAGEYRLPKHGIEYRTPSAAILANPALTFFAFDLCRFAFGIGQKGLNRIWESTDEEVQEAINNVDVDLAKRIVRKNKELLQSWTAKRYGGRGADFGSKVMTLVTKGVCHYMPGIDLKEKTIDLNVWAPQDHTPARFEGFLNYTMK